MSLPQMSLHSYLNFTDHICDPHTPVIFSYIVLITSVIRMFMQCLQMFDLVVVR